MGIKFTDLKGGGLTVRLTRIFEKLCEHFGLGNLHYWDIPSEQSLFALAVSGAIDNARISSESMDLHGMEVFVFDKAVIRQTLDEGKDNVFECRVTVKVDLESLDITIFSVEKI